MKTGLGWLSASLLFLSLTGHAEPRPAFPILNLEDTVRELGLRPFYSKKIGIHPIKVAILDNGFTGYEKQIGVSLPANTHYQAGPVQAPPSEEKHGLVMAQILFGLMTDSGRALQFQPELTLYNTFGYSNFKAAVEDAVKNKVDLILYSQVWEYGGNGDGHGFINQLVTQATDAGILWINASGDFGNTTFNSAIQTTDDDWVRLPGANQSVELRCEKAAPQGICPLRLVLSWNDFKDDVNLGTNRDLDLVLTDDTLNIIKTSTLIQTTDRGEQPGTSKYPREIIMADLKPGQYFVRVKNRSKNFDAHDRLRITASGDFITMPRHDTEESLLNPADHPRAITVGATDSEKSSLSRRLHKPEVATASLIRLSGPLSDQSTKTAEQYKGTSSAAAMIAAYFGILKSLNPQYKRENFLQEFSNHSGPTGPENGQGLPLSALEFTFTGFPPGGGPAQGCFVPVDLNLTPIPNYVRYALSLGGTLVRTTAGLKIFYNFDPIRLMPPTIHRLQANDLLVIGPATPFAPNGTTGLYPRRAQLQLDPAIIEVLQTPAEQTICSTPGRGF